MKKLNEWRWRHELVTGGMGEEGRRDLRMVK